MGLHHGRRPFGNTKARDLWISVHDTTGRVGSTTVELNFGPSTGDRTIDWGDGTVEIVNTAFPSHTYAVDGEYTVTCFGGTTTRLGERGSSPDDGWTKTLKSVRSWGDLGWTSFQDAFRSVSGNFELPRYVPLSVTTMRAMFRGTPFNQDIGGWDVSAVTDMRELFLSATSFNQDIGGWDTSSVTLMTQMFNGATAFNQNIASWNVSSVSDMRFMFDGASSFNQDLSTWSLRLAGVNMADIFDISGMSTENYSRTLVGWANYVSANADTPANVTLNATGITYNATDYAIGSTYEDAVEARTYLTGTPNWTITDGGQV